MRCFGDPEKAMRCFGGPEKAFHCKVVLLDERELIEEVHETTTGEDLQEVVFQHLNLIETAYFGLRFVDPTNQPHWLDPNKKLIKQLKGGCPHTLYFAVKFYSADPTKLLEEITRYQFFLQVKQDILQGRLPVAPELAAELGSYAVQSELGDYDPRRHSPGYVSEFRFVATQAIELENRIAELHKKLMGFVPSRAELCFLEKVKWLDMYGVDLHSVLGEDSTEYFLGLTPSGIIVLRNKVKVGNYFWPRITKVYFRGRFFMLRVKDKNNSESTYGFETPSKSACKHLWRCCVEHHAFFRLTQAAGNSPKAIFSLGSKYKFCGRTEKEASREAKAHPRPQTAFSRTPSRRYQRRIVEGAQNNFRTEEAESKPETRTVVALPISPTSAASSVYRATSLTLTPRSDSPRSTRSAPHPTGVHRQSAAPMNGSHFSRLESPRSAMPRRTPSAESHSSADSRSCHRSCSRHRRDRCRSSDGESEVSSRCSSTKGSHHRHHHKRRHRKHRNHSDDSSDHHKHRHRRHRRSRSNERQEEKMVESSEQWALVKSGGTPAKCHTATVRNLHDSPLGQEENELNFSVNSHSSRRRHRKHRSRSRSPSENSRRRNVPDAIRRHIDFTLQNSEGLSEDQLKAIPYTKVETSNIKGQDHRSSLSKSSVEDESQKTPSSNFSGKRDIPNGFQKETVSEHRQSGYKNGHQTNSTVHDHGYQNGYPNDSFLVPTNNYKSDIVNGYKTEPLTRTISRSSLETKQTEMKGTFRPFPRPVVGIPNGTLKNGPTAPIVTRERSKDGGFDSKLTNHCNITEDQNSGVFSHQLDSGRTKPPPTGPKTEKSTFSTSVLKPQPSPQSSVTSGISIGSSSVSISNDSTVTRSSRSYSQLNNEFPSPSQSQDLTPPSSSPDPEGICDQPVPPPQNKLNKSRTQPFYANSTPFCPIHSKIKDQNVINDSVTQHSTNILIQYHAGNASVGHTGGKDPLPTPRSSIISSIRCPDTSTHIVQAYGPPSVSGYANTQITSLKRLTPSRPSSSLSAKASQNDVVFKYSSLPRESPTRPAARPVTKSIGSQTPKLQNGFEEKENLINSVKDKIAFHERKVGSAQMTQTSLRPEEMTQTSLRPEQMTQTSLRPEQMTQTSLRPATQTSKKPLLTTYNSDPIPSPTLYTSHNNSVFGDGQKSLQPWQYDTNNSPKYSAHHWKVYNWDTNDGNWPNLTQELFINQRNGETSNQFRRSGSAGSLDLILGPLIQSALEHQQR